jgi:hypothetical protein
MFGGSSNSVSCSLVWMMYPLWTCLDPLYPYTPECSWWYTLSGMIYPSSVCWLVTPSNYRFNIGPSVHLLLTIFSTNWAKDWGHYLVAESWSHLIPSSSVFISWTILGRSPAATEHRATLLRETKQATTEPGFKMYTQVSDDAQLKKNSRDPLRMLYVHLGSYTSVYI